MRYILSLIGILGIYSYHHAQTITISEINYRSNATRDAGDWFEIYNYGSTPAILDGLTITDSSGIIYTIPSGTTLNAGSFLVLVSDIAKFIAEYPTVSNYIGPLGFALSKTSDMIRINNGAITLTQVSYTNEFPWPRCSNGRGRTWENIDISNAILLSTATRWKDGCMGGSPGTAYMDCNDNIVFSEINYNSDSLLNQGEFIELHNRTDAAINLTGYALRDSRDTITNIWYFPSGTMLPAYGYLAVSNDLVAINTIHSGITNVIGTLPFSLDNSGEAIRLFNASGRLIYSIVYDDTLSWPITPDGEGYTLELVNETGNVNIGSSYIAGCLGGSPGVVYSLPCVPLSIEDQSSIIAINPNPANDLIYITKLNNEKYDYELLSIEGKSIMHGYLDINNNAIAVNNLSTGIYFILLHKTNDESSLHKIFVKK